MTKPLQFFWILFFLWNSLYGQKNSIDKIGEEKLRAKSRMQGYTALLLEGDKNITAGFFNLIGVRIKYTAGNIFSIDIPNDQLEALLVDSKKSGIKKIAYSSPRGIPLNDEMLMNNNIDSIHQGFGDLISEFTGEGVLLGFIDTGIDFTHPDFKNPDNSTRIRYIWDQRGINFHNPPDPFAYGSEWTSEEINEGKCTHTDPSFYNGHGTNVAGTAAGNGRAVNNFKGVAPQSEIIVVATNFDKENWTSTVADAVKYIFTKADLLNKTCVVNISVGTPSGSHDGNDLAAKAIENMVLEKSGRAVVCAAGNFGLNKLHLGYVVNTDTSFTWFNHNSNLIIPGFLPSGGVFFELFSDTSEFNAVYYSIGVDQITPNYLAKGNTSFTTLFSSLNTIKIDTIKNLNNQRLAIVYTTSLEYNGVYQLQVMIKADSINGYKYRFSCTGSGKFDIWSNKNLIGSSDIEFIIPSATEFPSIINYKLPDSLKTISGSWACSEKIITVGSYINKNSYVDYNGEIQFLPENPGEISPTSSIGPNRTGTIKPDLTASGSNIFSSGRLATMQSLILSDPQNVAYGGMHNLNTGTSLASPIVAGLAALFFQKCPSTSAEELKNALIATAKKDSNTGTSPNNRWGYGKLNGFSALSSSNFPLVITNSNSATICSLDSAILSAPSGYNTYNWSNGENNETITVKNNGVFQVVVHNDLGCASKSQSITIKVNQSPTKPEITQNGNVLLSSPSNFYQWYRNGTMIAGAENQVYNVSENGSYKVEVINNNFCGAFSDSIEVVFTNVHAHSSNDRISIYPNPAIDFMNISMNSSFDQIDHLILYDLLGKPLLKKSIDDKEKKISINCKNYEKGVYILGFYNDNTPAYYEKIVIR